MNIHPSALPVNPEMSEVPLIRTIPRASTPETQVLVLGNLDETSLVSMMTNKARIQDPSWLRTMVQGGLIDVTHELSQATDEQDMRELLTQFRDRSLALTSFLKNATWQELPLPHMEGSHLSIPVFQAEEEFKDWFHQSAQRVLESMKVLTAQGPFADIARDSEGDQGQHLITVASRWMAAACLLDSPKTLEMLTDFYQPAIHQAFPLSLMGDAFYDFVHDLPKPPQPSLDDDNQDRAESILVTPAFVALMLSRIDCLDILHRANPKGLMTLASVYDGESDERKDLDLHNLHKHFIAVCKPEAYTHALDLFVNSNNLQALIRAARDDIGDLKIQDLKNVMREIEVTAFAQACPPRNPPFPAPPDPALLEIHRQGLADAEAFKRQQLLDAGLSLLPVDMHAMRPYVRSFLETGIFDFGISESVVQAVAHGHPHVVDRFRDRMPWSDILPQDDLAKRDYHFADENPIYLAARHAKQAPEGASEAAALTFIAAAQRDGQLDGVLAHGAASHALEMLVSPNVTKQVRSPAIEPLSALADAGMSRVIVKFLEHGLDPQSKPDPGTPSVLETAEKNSPDIAQTIRTFLARQRVFAALDEIEAEKAPSTAPGV